MFVYTRADNHRLFGSFSKDDGYGNENVSPKYNLALSQVFRD